MKNSKLDTEIRIYKTSLERRTHHPVDQETVWKKNKDHVFTFIENIEGNLEGKFCLEIGCGLEGFAAYFASKGATLIEGDLIIDSLYTLKSSVSGDTEAVCLDAMRLPFKENTFDIVFCVGLVHHLDPIDTALHEMVRCLKKGGLICLVEPNRSYIPVVLMWILPRGLVNTIRRKLIPRILRWYTKSADYERPLFAKEVERSLRKTGINDCQSVFDSGPLPYLPVPIRKAQSLLGELIDKLGLPFSNWFSWQFITIGRKP